MIYMDYAATSPMTEKALMPIWRLHSVITAIVQVCMM